MHMLLLHREKEVSERGLQGAKIAREERVGEVQVDPVSFFKFFDQFCCPRERFYELQDCMGDLSIEVRYNYIMSPHSGTFGKYTCI
jgi:hypothetical protein